MRHFSGRFFWACYVLINGFVTIGLLSAVAVISHTPFVFPSLGPTAFLFFSNPRGVDASPRSAVIGHAVAIVCGYGSLLLFGLQNSGSALATGVTWPRAMAAALSLATTGALVILLDAPHPPAGATTLIVALGALDRLEYLGVIEVAVVLLALQAVLINRLAGLDYPLWRWTLPAPEPPGRDSGAP